jgi:hypothetical protein
LVGTNERNFKGKKKNRACELFLLYKKKKENVYQNELLRMKRDGESENGRSD